MNLIYSFDEERLNDIAYKYATNGQSDYNPQEVRSEMQAFMIGDRKAFQDIEEQRKKWEAEEINEARRQHREMMLEDMI